MNKIKVAVLTILWAAGLPAQDINNLLKRYEVVSVVTGEDTSRAELKTREGLSVQMVWKTPPTDAQLAIIDRLNQTFAGWKAIKVAKVQYSLSDTVIDVNVTPLSFTDDSGKDLTDVVRGGFTMVYTNALEYNFRIVVDKLYIRIKGFYTTEAELTGKIASALKDPAAFVRSRDPEFILAKLDTLEGRVERADARIFQLENQTASMGRDLDRFQKGVLYLHNKGFFSGAKPVSEKEIALIRQIYDANPGWSAEQIAEDIEKSRKEGDPEISEREVRLVLAIFYARFPKD